MLMVTTREGMSALLQGRALVRIGIWGRPGPSGIPLGIGIHFWFTIPTSVIVWPNKVVMDAAVVSRMFFCTSKTIFLVQAIHGRR